VLGGQRLAVGLVATIAFSSSSARERHVLGVPGLGVRDREVRGRLRPAELGELAPVDAAEAGVEAAPARDAVDVGRDLRRRQRRSCS
jgi:hypothetical protein